ncbi:FxLD family lanthipeptide [Streptomyces sp. NPDC057428]|uniref:FxLD family lanthipeptide n=1 Tax=Streptomyces sp. NPDC057428 TaxID=3346129 RepID=UPI0036917D43
MTAVMPEQTAPQRATDTADLAEDPFALDLSVTTDLGGLGMPAACGTGDGCAASCASSCASAV